MLLDEPTAALGIVQTAQILELIERLRDRGLGVIVISHNLADVFQVADRVAVLRLGRMAGDFEVGEVEPGGDRRRDHRRRVGERADGGDATMSDGADHGDGRVRRDRPRGGSRSVQALRRLGRGELGSVRVLLGIAVIWTIFQIANDRFLSAVNLSNLTLQIAAVATISIGVVLVLLLGEIDLSVGAVSGLAAAVMAVLSVKEGWSPELAIARRAAASAPLIGLFNGFMVTTFGIPSFVVTLAGLLGWQGAQLWRARRHRLGQPAAEHHHRPDQHLLRPGRRLGARRSPAIAAYAASQFSARRRRLAAGLEARADRGHRRCRSAWSPPRSSPRSLILNADRGVPLAALIVVALTVLFTFITERTRYGRHIFAVGGNEEAARRAGIRVNRIKISVFTLASTLAAAGGILAASRAARGQPAVGQRRRAAARDRRPGDRRHQPLRRPRLRLVGAARARS